MAWHVTLGQSGGSSLPSRQSGEKSQRFDIGMHFWPSAHWNKSGSLVSHCRFSVADVQSRKEQDKTSKSNHGLFILSLGFFTNFLVKIYVKTIQESMFDPWHMTSNWNRMSFRCFLCQLSDCCLDDVFRALLLQPATAVLSLFYLFWCWQKYDHLENSRHFLRFWHGFNVAMIKQFLWWMLARRWNTWIRFG